MGKFVKKPTQGNYGMKGTPQNAGSKYYPGNKSVGNATYKPISGSKSHKAIKK